MESSSDDEAASKKMQQDTSYDVRSLRKGQATVYDTIPPLSDPHRQIRLLYLYGLQSNNTSSRNVDIIIGKTSVWSLNDAPDFYAIAYTWGRESFHNSIMVNGVRRRVRQNCAYALWQARLYCPNSYIWIKSMCINQESSRERGTQVAMMADIYEKAKEVLECI